jgi:transcription initiation factor TFIIH subunit 1
MMVTGFKVEIKHLFTKSSAGLQPLRARQDIGEKLIDLAATEEDHGDVLTHPKMFIYSCSMGLKTGNIQDITMQAGKQKAALPLIRRFNEHSERLLKTSLYAPHSLIRLISLKHSASYKRASSNKT